MGTGLDIYGYGVDYYGYRKKFGVLVPSTNTTVEVEYNAMRPEGVITATRPCVIPPFVVTNEEEFVGMVKAISEATEPGLRDLLTVKPDHVVFGYSAETFWDGKQRSDAMFKRYDDIAQEIAGCGITFGAQVDTVAPRVTLAYPVDASRLTASSGTIDVPIIGVTSEGASTIAVAVTRNGAPLDRKSTRLNSSHRT